MLNRNSAPTGCARLLRPRHAIAAAILGVGLSACATLPHYSASSNPATPAEFFIHDAAVPADPPPDRWWVALGDPTLNGLIERALSDNPDLATAEARVQQARAQARSIGAAFYPSANFNGRVSRDKLSEHGENLALIPFTPSTTEFTDYRLGFDASWEIDLAGKTRRDVEAAVARLGSSAESRNDARLVIAADVANAYVDLHAAAARLELAQHMLSSFDETLRLIELQERAGLAAETERRRADADRLNEAGALPPLIAERQSALLQLAALVGAEAQSLAAELSAAGALPDVPLAAPVGLPADLLRRRPDVRRAERDLAATTADAGSAVAAQFPRLSLTGGFGWDSVHSGDLTAAASRYWNVAPQLTVPLFAGGRLRAQVEAAEAARDAALYSYRSIVLRALSDTETSIVRFTNERKREATLAAASDTVAVNADLERRRHAAGDSSMIEVLAAERALYQAVDQRVASQAQLTRDYVALGKALGGGWQ